MALPPDHITANGTALTVELAGLVLSRYLQSFGANPSTCRHTVTYTVIPAADLPVQVPAPSGPHFDATLALPPAAGSGTFSTHGPYPSKLMAKRVACWDACKALLDKGELDDSLGPTPKGVEPREKKPRVREWRDPASLSRWVEEGDRVLKPEDEDLQRGLSLSARWEVFKGTIRNRLPEASPAINGGVPGVGVYEALVPEGVDEVVERRAWMTALQMEDGRALALLTSKRLADGVEELELKPGVGMRLVDMGELKKLSEEQHQQAIRYTEQVIRSQLNKDLHPPPAGPTWLVLPLIRNFAPGKAKRTDIDWAEIASTLAIAPTSVPFSVASQALLEQELVDAVATSPAEFGRRFYVEEWTNLIPSFPHPAEITKSILNYSFQKFGPPVLEYPDQRVFTASIATSGRSGGILNSSPSTPIYLMPELTQRYCFPASTYRSLSTIPTFFVMLTDHLAAKQFNRRLFDNSLTPALALQALTPAMSAPNQPNRSYERLEILGDTLIKLLTTLDTCLRGPLSDNSRVDRHILLSNRSLRANGVEAGIASYIRPKEGRAKAWVPEGWTLGGVEVKAEEGKRTVKIGDKVVADVVESLVGAAYLSSPTRSLDAAISCMKRLKIPIDRLEAWSDVSRMFARQSSLEIEVDAQPAPVVPEPTKAKVKADPMGWMKAFTKPVAVSVMGYTFRDAEKGNIIFTRGRQDFQQYKLIGDSLLDYFVVERLYDVPENYTPAEITHMKHSRAADQALAAMAVCLGLADRVVEIDRPVKTEIDRYMVQISTRFKEAQNVLKRRSKQGVVGEAVEEAGGNKVTEFWFGASHAPTLGAIPEVLLGAVVADQNGDLAAARKLFNDNYWPFMEQYGVGPINHSLHPKSVMQERLGKLGCTSWKIVRLDEKVKGVVCAVQLHGQEIGRGFAESQNLATRVACENVLATLKEETVRDICSCRWEEAKEGQAVA